MNKSKTVKVKFEEIKYESRYKCYNLGTDVPHRWKSTTILFKSPFLYGGNFVNTT